jgi:hypothetical protein
MCKNLKIFYSEAVMKISLKVLLIEAVKIILSPIMLLVSIFVMWSAISWLLFFPVLLLFNPECPLYLALTVAFSPILLLPLGYITDRYDFVDYCANYIVPLLVIVGICSGILFRIGAL